MVLPGYELAEEVFKDDRFVFRRGVRRADAARVIVKAAANSWPDTAGQSLQREYELLSGLSVPGVPTAHECLRRDDRAYLVVEDRGLAPLAALPRAARTGIGLFFRIAAAVAKTLAELHRREIVHAGISPAGIWLDSQDGLVQLWDFSRAVRSSAEAQATAHVGCALTYISPEQTGRMNRVIDYRTDFYSLGATLYEVLTGAPPFEAGDPLELIHAHIAKQPAPPERLMHGLPEPVSQIVMKLLAKTAEERYQGAGGLLYDLEVCRAEWSERRSVAPFALASRDIPEKFLVPQRLYGRDVEVRQLLDAFERASKGCTTLALVRGYAGIGKTSLIQELYKPIVRQRGYFIHGKFDQVARNTPYGALIQAFRSLVQQLLTESEARVSTWRTRLSQTLGAGSAVLTAVIPELELILGRQPEPPPLGPAEAQNRLRYVFQNFAGALASREHPLILFLDDLQWADSGSVSLLQPLLASPDVRYLLVIGAYRDQEVAEDHPLLRAFASLEAAGARLARIDLAPLRLPDLAQLLSDALHRERAEVEPLARVILQKTDGNPFFVVQFLKTLHEEGLVSFDQARGRWMFDTAAVAGAAITDNVVDLMTNKIRRLEAGAQKAVTVAACIGGQFDSPTLSAINGESLEATGAALQEVLREGLIAASGPEDGWYRFVHDRVQQAAYSMVPRARRPEIHLAAGRLLLARMQASGSEDRLFEIVQHLDRAHVLMRDQPERVETARLNLRAGRKAKASAAFQPALAYLRAGIGLLEGRCPESERESLWNLRLEAAECEYLCGRFAEAEADFNRLLADARTVLDRAAVQNLRIVLYETMARYEEAVRCGREGLALFGVAFPEAAAGMDAALDDALSHIDALLEGRAIASLVEVPPMQDPAHQAVMRLLTALWAPAYLSGNQPLTRLISAAMVRLSLSRGNAEESAYGYVTHAITVGPVKGDYRSAYEWGSLALRVNERFNDAKRRAKVHQQFNAHVTLWRKPFETCIHHAREARRSGLESGDFTYAGYGILTETWAALLTVRSLPQFARDCEAAVALLDKINMSGLVLIQRVILNWARALEGRTEGRLSLSDGTFEEAAFLAACGGHAFSAFFLYVAKLFLCLLYEAGHEGLDLAARARAAAGSLSGTVWPVFLDVLHALTLTGMCEQAGVVERVSFDDELERIRRRFADLAENCPENFGCWSLLLEAETHRIHGRDRQAQTSYEQAIQQARATGSLLNDALSCELYARSWRGCGNQSIAQLYFGEAARAWARLGGFAKVAELEERYSVRPAEAPNPVDFDIETVAKAAHAIASELVLEDLLRRLVEIALENAGAQRCIYLREREGVLVIDAEATLDPRDVRVLQSGRPDTNPGLAWEVVRYVHKTGESIVIGDAVRDDRFQDSAYIRSARPRSIMCASVVHQGRAAGILYFENNLAADAFTQAHLRVVRILASQAAISLENARLYSEMKEEVARRRAAETELRSALDEVRALERRLEAENVYLREEIRKEHNFEEIVGNSPALLEVLDKVEKVAPADSTVLICGETGTGKELVARAVHSRSARRHRPLVKVNCGAISAGLVESELFGHVKGAFTGAIERRVGRFEIADGGTLFLDEVSELPLETQVKLLRILQEGEFEPVGSSRTQRVDVRIIAATNRDLGEAVRAGRFRSDLFYRLNVFPLNLPPLRERRSDIPQLVMFFVSRFAKRFGRKFEAVSRDSIDLLVNYDWPGNIREMQNLIERAVVLSPGPVLSIGAEFAPRGGEVKHPPERHLAAGASMADGGSGTLEDVERRHILTVLASSGWVIEGPRGAARALDLHPNTLRSRMKKLGISRSAHGRA